MLFIDYFKKRGASLVFCLTFLVYSPMLFNNYVGDDYHVLAGNTFYRSWHNIPSVFGKESITNTRERIFSDKSQTNYGTGRDSYRPISNLTYFLDGYLFPGEPCGSHLINILIHSFNAVLIYWMVTQIFSSWSLGILAGLLFALHPIQSEAVAVISFRSDIVTGMFVLCSFCLWIKFRKSNYERHRYYWGSLASCFLALLSKESAFTLPFLFLLFDQILDPPALQKQREIYYFGFILVFILYVYLYFVLFPNIYHPFHWLGDSPTNHCLVIGYIWYGCLINVLLPWTVKMIPAQHSPPVPLAVSLLSMEAGIAFIMFATSTYFMWHKHKKCLFFLGWYIIFYLPVSNMFPIVNPMAHRYMYLPSIGLLIIIAFCLYHACNSAFLKKHLPYLSRMLPAAIIVICLTKSLFLVGDWKNNFDLGIAWVRDYPKDHQGYAVVGGEYFAKGDFKKAEEYLGKSIQLGGLMPKELILLATCYLKLGEDSAAESLLEKEILYYPDYYLPYLYLGEIYYRHQHYVQAQTMLKSALTLNPRQRMNYTVLMEDYLKLNQLKSATDLIMKAHLYLNKRDVLELNQLLKT